MTHHEHDHNNHVFVDEPQLRSSLSNSTTSIPFCTKMSNEKGMTMYMDGFHFTLLQPRQQQLEHAANNNHDLDSMISTTHPCLCLFSPKWILDSRSKFLLALMTILCMAIMMEYISLYKIKCTNLYKNKENRSRLRITMTICQYAQVLLGYLLMLAAMSYSIELLFTVVTGICSGYYLTWKVKEQYQSQLYTPLLSTNNSLCCESNNQDPIFNYSGISNATDKLLELDDDNNHDEETKTLLSSTNNSSEIRKRLHN